MGRFTRWIRESERALGRKVEYVAGVEYQKNGWAHLHPLLDIGGVTPGDIMRVGGLWYRKNGYNLLEKPRDSLAVSRYAAKYLTKNLGGADVVLSEGLRTTAISKQGMFTEV